MEKNKNKLYFMMAGEASGDLHGYYLIKSLKHLNSNLKFFGVGGPKMAQAGFISLLNFKRFGVMGFIEVLKDIFFFIKAKKILLNNIKKKKPSKIILIDYPGFNLALAKAIKKNFNIPIILYISPQVWAWKEKRVFKIKKYIDQLIVIFPFEVSWFKKRGIEVHYFGHPLIDIMRAPLLSQKKPINIALFPGSRDQEIKKHLPLLQQTIKKIKKLYPETEFILCKAPGLGNHLSQKIDKIKNLKILSDSQEVLRQSSLAIVASGTATLECAISQTPCIVIYKTSFFNWLIAKYFLSIKFISIVNILAQKPIVPELLQKNASPQKIANEVIKIQQNSATVQNNLKKIRKSLGRGEAYKQTALFIYKY